MTGAVDPYGTLVLGWWLAHPAILAGGGFIILCCLILLAFGMWLDRADGEIATEITPANADPLILPCTEAMPYDPQFVEWTSRWAEHQEWATGEFPAIDWADQLAVLKREAGGNTWGAAS